MNKTNPIPPEVQQAFHTYYPNASNAEGIWDEEGFYVFYFKADDVYHEAAFDEKGNWLQSIIEMGDENELPELAILYLDENYYDAILVELLRIQDDEGVGYIVVVKQGNTYTEIVFDSKGIVLSEEEEVQNEEEEEG